EMGFGPRNLVETTPQRLASISYSHPEMQEALLVEAERAGAQVRRGTMVQAVEPKTNGSAVVARNGKDEKFTGRLVVGADGRGSAVRKWAGFPTRKNAQPFQFAGVLLTGVSTREDGAIFLFNPDHGLVVGVIPQTQQRCRAYLGYPTKSGPALHGS